MVRHRIGARCGRGLVEIPADGLVEVRAGQVAMTERGRPLVGLAAAAFDTYLADSTGRHSVAV